MANEFQSGVNLRGTGQGAAGAPGINGSTPYIGPNGNWWINGVDQKVNATFSASDIIQPGAHNELLKYDAGRDMLVPSGAFSPKDGELVASTNSIFLGDAHSVTSAGRNVAFRNLFTGKSFSPVVSPLDAEDNSPPVWRHYTDTGMTEVVLESVTSAVLTNPMFTTGAPFDRRTFRGEILPSENQTDLWFEVYVGSVQVWRANLGPVTGGKPLQFYMDDYSAPYDLRSDDVVYVRILGKVRGNMTTGRAYLKGWYRKWEELRLLDSRDLAVFKDADSSESAARILGDQQSRAYTDSSVASEASLRLAGDSSTLANAKSYADSLSSSEAATRNAAISTAITMEVSNRNAAITSAMTGEISARNAAISAAVSTEVGDRNAAVSAGVASAKAYSDSVAIMPGAPVARSLTFGTAQQSLVPTKPAFISAVVESTYTVTVAGNQSDTVELRIGPTAADVTNATSASIVVASWKASLTGIALTVGLAIADRGQLSAMLPVGWYFALRRTAGTTAAIVSAVDQPMRA